ncbi:MAG: DUF1653 domain-containing protein [archaeon]
MEIPKEGEVWQHFKGEHMKYKIIAITNDTETQEKRVVYEQLYEGSDYPKGTLWDRPLKMFMSTKVVDGKEIQRFTKKE